MTPALQVVWFKRDLRVHDHPALFSAAQRGPVLPLYIVEPDLWRQPDASARQWMFVADSLRELRDSLAELGQPLIVRVGNAINVLEALRRQRPIAALWSHQETGNNWTYQRDRQVAAWAAAQSVTWHEPVQCGVTRRLASRDGWARRWDKLMAQPVLQVPEALPGLTPAIDPGDIPDARSL